MNVAFKIIDFCNPKKSRGAIYYPFVFYFFINFIIFYKLLSYFADFHVLEDGSNYPYMEAKSKDLAMEDVDILLHQYKELVSKHTILCKAINGLTVLEKESLLHQLEMQGINTNASTNDQTTLHQDKSQ